MSAPASSASLTSRINFFVFLCSTVLIILLVAMTAIYPQHISTAFTWLQQVIMANASWFYIAAVALILVCTAYLGLSRFGAIKLGPDHATPDFSFASWFSMLFSAGMGVGLVFFGVSEPVLHFLSPPIGQGGTMKAAKEAMNITFFHWGLHAWAIYAIVALILAFFGYRRGLPLTLKSALYPLIGQRINGPIGYAVDVFSILCTVFGVATTMGYGVLQVNAGLNYLLGININTQNQVFLIVGITALATLSVATGLKKGIKYLSEANLFIALLLLLAILCLGPTSFLFRALVENTGNYFSGIIDKTFNLYTYSPHNKWLGGWTLFYWAWWISCAPFVGMFIARISRGRTIREFVGGVMLVPAGLTFIWMTVFGNSAIELIANQGAADLGSIVQHSPPIALFKFLEYFPMSHWLSVLAVILIVIFFVTTADSSAMVIDIIACNGYVDKLPVWQRVFWSLVIGLVAMALLLAGGLKALQAATIVSAFPFTIIILVLAYVLIKELRIEIAKKESLVQTPLTPKIGHQPIPWQKRLKNLTHFAYHSDVKTFINRTVLEAMQSIIKELNQKGFEGGIGVNVKKASLTLRICHGDEYDFIYQVYPRKHQQPSFISNNEHYNNDQCYVRAEVFLREGGQNYDIMGWTKEQVIGDIIDQYEKHMHFLHKVR
ncbi:MAG: BCCT family transporter [Endozoicomonas sp. (ex Botrylloides leachii)]|nr:BCCT family transporter [Endozoicomonas sp. (ex Botrylloides leachii)]